MACIPFPVIDMEATGRNICRLRQEAGLTVRDLQVMKVGGLYSLYHIG